MGKGIARSTVSAEQAAVLKSGRGLVHGVWCRDVAAHPDWPRIEEAYRAGGFDAPIDIAALRAEPERFHLYIAHPCPFAHRVVMVRALLGLSPLGMSVCHPWLGGPDGWHFAPVEGKAEGYAGLTRDKLFGASALHQVYAHADLGFTGRVTVPVLFDRARGTIASNDSFAIALALLAAFDPNGDALGMTEEDAIRGRPDAGLHADPATALEMMGAEPLALSRWVASEVTLGAYRAGMADNQAAYDEAARSFFARLDALEGILEAKRAPFLLGTRPSLADLILFASLVRLEPAYAGALYLTLKRLDAFPRMATLVRKLLADPRIAETVHPDQIARHYFDDDAFVNRARDNGRFIVPLPPQRRHSGRFAYPVGEQLMAAAAAPA